MKNFILIIFLAMACAFSYDAKAQIVSTIDTSKTYIVIKNDGADYIGQILSKDSREILIRTNTIGEIYISMADITSIKEFTNRVGADGNFMYDDPFATRYFLTTNALPLEKGETYALFNWFGPEIHHGATDRFGVGVMTTWVSIPIVATFKYSFPIDEEANINFAVGTLLGGVWVGGGGFGALPFASLTFGNRTSNIAFTGGGVVTSESEFQPLFSIGGLASINSKMSFIFDSMIIIPTNEDGFSTGLFTPGARFNSKRSGSAFQFGFSLAVIDGELFQIPLPNFGWFKTI